MRKILKIGAILVALVAIWPLVSSAEDRYQDMPRANEPHPTAIVEPVKVGELGRPEPARPLDGETMFKKGINVNIQTGDKKPEPMMLNGKTLPRNGEGMEKEKMMRALGEREKQMMSATRGELERIKNLPPEDRKGAFDKIRVQFEARIDSIKKDREEAFKKFSETIDARREKIKDDFLKKFPKDGESRARGLETSVTKIAEHLDGLSDKLAHASTEMSNRLSELSASGVDVSAILISLDSANQKLTDAQTLSASIKTQLGQISASTDLTSLKASIKTLSNNLLDTKKVLIGVRDSIKALVVTHNSTDTKTGAPVAPENQDAE